MNITDDVAIRRLELEAELDGEIKREKHAAEIDYWIGVYLMIFALVSSFLAGIGGIAGWFSASVTGGIALIPGAMALVATTLKFEAKSDWHYRKQYALKGLKDRLRFESPLEISVEQISAIARERRELFDKLNKEWRGSLSLSWNQFKHH